MFEIYPGLLTQIILIAISPLGIISYYFAFRIASVDKTNRLLKLNNILYNMGLSTNIILTVMIFVKQPRFLGFIDAIQGESISVVGIITSIFGLCIAICFIILEIIVFRINFNLTKSNYFAPQTLLTNGMYNSIRNPMCISGFFINLGLCLCTGAYYTFIVSPVYFILNNVYTIIEEKFVLEPKFSEEFREYKKNTPRYFNWWLMLLFILCVLAVIVNYLYVDIQW